jgi:hypothetical protein
MKHNKRQYKPHLKWGDLYIRLNPSVDYLRGPPYFGSRREYQFIALVSLVDAFYSDIEEEIEICPDPLPHVASFLSLVRRPFQGSGIHLTLAECFHLNRFVDYIIIRGTLEPVKNPLGGYGVVPGHGDLDILLVILYKRVKVPSVRSILYSTT